MIDALNVGVCVTAGYQHPAARGLGFSCSQPRGDVVAAVRSLYRRGPLRPAPPARQRTAEQAWRLGKIIWPPSAVEGWGGWVSLA
jgi:hypothetical protein